MTLGPLMVDVVGLELSDEERDILHHPSVGGIILFSRNYQSPEQIKALIDDIRGLREPHLLISVDHEGGRVQRFRSGFTRLPAIGEIGKHYKQHPKQTLKNTEIAGWLMATELRAIAVDFSFAPVLDLDYGVSEIIGDRSFSRDPEAVASMAYAYIQGMKRAWMPAIGKHFPGHGAVEVDSHLALPVDTRHFEDMLQADILPFSRLCQTELAGIMLAHIIYQQCDGLPASFSPFWIKEILRDRFGFQGAILSDDISMEGAAVMGDSLARAEAALSAGCDMVLVCNKPESVVQVIDGLKVADEPLRHTRLIRLHGRHGMTRNEMLANQEWKQAAHILTRYLSDSELELDFT